MGRSKSVSLEAHAAQDGLRPGLQLVAVRVLEGGLQRAQLVQQLARDRRPRAAGAGRAGRRRRRRVGLG